MLSQFIRQLLLSGGAYDTVPEVCMLLAIFNHSKDYHPVIFDEAGTNFSAGCAPSDTIGLGHRVATQYLLSALEGAMPAEHLFEYRKAGSHLPGHPELGFTPGIKFSSGRLGHMWCVRSIIISNAYTHSP